jgi:virginiamycin B lyase
VVAFVATACGGGGGAATHFLLRTKNSEPVGITTGPDGHMWFTEFTPGRIRRITTDGALDEFPVPTLRAGPYGIVTGPDGNLWFTEFAGDRIGRITPQGDIREFPFPVPGAALTASQPDPTTTCGSQNNERTRCRITPTG